MSNNTPKSNEPKAADPADPNQGSGGSINEPPGSNVLPPAAPPTAPPVAPQAQPKGFERELLPSDSELHKMTRAELGELADERGVDVSSASNKDEVIELLRKDARKRK
ncbi:hypothetical protein EHM76_00130 [bacterium]|nr:MAG: hypothetical protein EHM76_00130 [bacterium]